jgi:parvulin-like peptidyl-prolyl isomerase
MLAREMVNVEQNTFVVTPEMIDTYYQAHRELYEETKIKGILIRFKPTNITQGTTAENIAQAAQEAFGQANNDRAEADALALAKKVVEEIRGGADFLEMVNKYSEDRSSKEKGGELPTIRIDSTLPQDFRQAVVALKAGDVSEPIRQPTGFYIVRVEERTLQPVADVRGEIIDAIRREHRDAWLNEINQRFRVDIKDPKYFQPQAPAGFSALPGQQ